MGKNTAANDSGVIRDASGRPVRYDRVHCVALLEDVEHRLLYVQEPGFTYRGLFYFPSGKLDGEEIVACLRRELLEEAGYRLDQITSMFSVIAKNLATGDTSLIYVASVLAHCDLSVRPDSLDIRFMADDQIKQFIRSGSVRDPELVLEFLRIFRASPEVRAKLPSPFYLEFRGNGNYERPAKYQPPEARHDYERFRIRPPRSVLTRVVRKVVKTAGPLKKLVL